VEMFFFCNISDINIYNTTNYVGIYNNKPFYFQKRIQNPSYNKSKNFLNFNFSNTNIQKAKQFSVGDYVMIRDLPHTYVIFGIEFNGSRVHLYNLSKPDSSSSFYVAIPEELVKIDFNYSNSTKRSYANVVKGKKTLYPIPDDIQKIINNSKNK